MNERNASHIEALVKDQNSWRETCLNLIASENVTSRRVRGLMGSDFAHRYAEGHPGERYYQGTEIIDEIESLLKQQMKGLFRCRHTDVRPISGTIANDAVFSRYIRPGDVVMVNSTPGGRPYQPSPGGLRRKVHEEHRELSPHRGRLAHRRGAHPRSHESPGAQSHDHGQEPLPVSRTGEGDRPVTARRRESTSFMTPPTCWGSSRDTSSRTPWRKGAPLVTASTHKTFFGSQRGVILSNLDDDEWRKIDKGAFPGSSSNHHLETLVALTFATYEMMEFGEEYARQVVANAKHFARKLFDLGFKVPAEQFGFTESHQVAIDMSDLRRRSPGRPDAEGQPDHRQHESSSQRAPGPGDQPRGHPAWRAGNDQGRHEGAGDGAALPRFSSAASWRRSSWATR